MIGSPAPRPRRALVALLSGALVGLTVACAPSTYEIAVETRLPPKLDVTPFQRVLVAGFLVGGDTDVDGNQETVRLLRSQLRTKSGLRVLDADPFSLASVVREQVAGSTTQPLPAKIREEKDLEPFTRLFANTAYWKRVGEEYQQPLIVTGAIYFTPQTRSGYVTREVEVVDALGRRTVQQVRTFMERKGYVLHTTVVYLDGRTGAQLHSDTSKEEVLYPAQQETPALSAYFELMDRVVPGFLSTISAQQVKGTRVLLP